MRIESAEQGNHSFAPPLTIRAKMEKDQILSVACFFSIIIFIPLKLKNTNRKG